MPRKIVDLDAHFHSLLSKDTVTGCWNWIGMKYWTGYGVFYIERKGYAAHRIAYEMYIGPIPKGLLVLHKCDNRACCNPEHLWLGKHKDNTNDCIDKGRFKVLPGSKNHNAKLDERQVVEMRGLYHNAGFSITELASTYGVSQGNVHRIVNNKMWKHV